MSQRFYLFLLSAFIVWTYAGRVDARVRIEGTRFLDESGRQLVFRGANAGSLAKFPPHHMPFELSNSFSEAEFQDQLDLYTRFYADNGFNIARITMMHSAAAPSPGTYDYEYFSRLKRLIQSFGDRGVYVILDGHQDLFSARFCGDGFADWMLPERWQSRSAPESCRLWELRYFSPGVTTAFHQFWSNHRGIQDLYIEYLGEVARQLGHYENVLGIEPMNEPVPGYGILYNPLAAWTYRDWAENRLYAFYKRSAEEIHKQDSDLLIFGDLGPGETLGWAGSRFKNPEITNFALAPHFYQVMKPGYRNGRSGMKITENTAREIGRDLDVKLRLAERWRVPAIIGEYGAEMEADRAGEYLALVNQAMEQRALSSIVWEASLGESVWNGRDKNIMTPQGHLRERAEVLRRPYPQAVAGEIVSFHFIDQTGEFSLSYWEKSGEHAETRIYYPYEISEIQIQPSRPYRRQGPYLWVGSGGDQEAVRILIKAADYSSKLKF